MQLQFLNGVHFSTLSLFIHSTHTHKMASALSNGENKNYGVLLNKVNDLQVVEIPMPTPKEDEVQVQVKATGICGSDIHLWKHGEIGIFPVTRPQLLGHESAGIVTNVGSNVHDLQIGDRVAIEA